MACVLQYRNFLRESSTVIGLSMEGTALLRRSKLQSLFRGYYYTTALQTRRRKGERGYSTARPLLYYKTDGEVVKCRKRGALYHIVRTFIVRTMYNEMIDGEHEHTGEHRQREVRKKRACHSRKRAPKLYTATSPSETKRTSHRRSGKTKRKRFHLGMYGVCVFIAALLLVPNFDSGVLLCVQRRGFSIESIGASGEVESRPRHRQFQFPA